jgi:hypothetical protein
MSIILNEYVELGGKTEVEGECIYIINRRELRRGAH